MKPYAFGVDVGGTTIKLGFFRSDGTLVDKWEIPTRTANHGEDLLRDIALALLSKMAEHNIGPDEVEGVGMGVPGAVLSDSYVKPCVNLNQWGDFDVAEELSELCKMPVKIVNDANAAALGEMGAGGGKGYRNIVFVTLGTGVGGGVIAGGKLLAGSHGAGGEIGHIKVKEAEETACGCGKRGCLEQYASATGIVNSARKYLTETRTSTALREFEDLTCKDIFDCAKKGDDAAIRLVEEMTDMLGKALASISCVCDPEIFVIGGGVSKGGDILIDNIRRAFRKYAFPSAEDTEFALATLGNDAGIYGGVQMILG